mmetsp:Transcript_25766/g.60406  ORF Transcript_25766/g.60406 Transcript_25766/m.60406 type:complete len:451 (-) Transcript_25766:35-1387(-)|eukprot:CAMPEP_0197184164 /NCGR_PEP_ID=MMETSP1423-20130617/9329_1 /TAXON_ID=476441 /ORGANISM="Pseudo-nitzschia heimii, Strain UNC1101" /LENGTH=450 /DNA_ID=CAMNT_0042634911 /DNA_START=19 /DNA_END=1371 /DNA_ORIENTATION=-
MTKSIEHLDLARGVDHHGLKISNHGLKISNHGLKISNHGLNIPAKAPKEGIAEKNPDIEATNVPVSKKVVPYIHIDHPFHLKNDLKFAFTYSDESVSIGSSVCSGLRNSLLSSLSSLSFDYDYDDIDSSSEGSSSGGSSSEDSSFVDGRETPSWRLKPKKSKSDWTLTIESVPEGIITRYNVHKKMMIQNGRKSSEFFKRFFGDSSIKKKKPIKIHEDAAKLIDIMLDYMYSIDDKLQVTSKSAVGLRHLSQFFGIRGLAKRVSCFIHEDVCLDNMDIYMETSSAYDDLQISALCADRCAEEVESIHPLSPLVAEMDPSFILSILSSKKFDRMKYSKHMSHIMTGYFITQRGAIDGSVFEELTADEYLPFIDMEAALPLLILESALVNESKKESDRLSSLQLRCVDGILPLFRGVEERNISEAEKKSRKTAMQKVPKKVLVQILSMISSD